MHGHDSGLQVLLPAVVLALLAAGCLVEEKATAQNQAPIADDRAEAWSKDARLVQVVGVEGSLGAAAGFASGDRMPDLAYWETNRTDDEPEDGVPPVWVYRYTDPQQNGTLLEVAVDEQGQVLEENLVERAPDALDPIPPWNVDSDEAVETALEANDPLSKASSKDTFGLVLVLQVDQAGNSTWLVAGGGGDENAGGGGQVVIDARSGEVLDSRGAFGS